MKKIIILFTSFLIIGSYSCKKYEDGPEFSFQTKKMRVVNIWVLDKMIQHSGSTEIPLTVDRTKQIEFFYNNTYERAVIATDSVYERGKWDFDNKREHIELMKEGTSSEVGYKILRLTGNEMWISQGDDFNYIEYQYVTK